MFLTEKHLLQPAILAAALVTAEICSSPALAVRVNADGHGQALIFPYYTARTSNGSNAFVTALSTTNTTNKPKALKVRFLEGKTGAEVFDFNLYLAAYDVWTAGIVATGNGAGIFTTDQSCTSPQVSRSSNSPSLFRNATYVGDTLGDSLDRTLEGYFEMLEMATIDPQSELGLVVTPSENLSAPNASRPSCSLLPSSVVAPDGLSRPSGGITGNTSFINVNEGTDYNADAIALNQWSDKVQWSAAGSPHPNLADVSPAVSVVVADRADGHALIFSQWDKGRDAISALFMVDHVVNEYTVEPGIKAATDWVVTMPTARFYLNGKTTEPPFSNQYQSSSRATPPYSSTRIDDVNFIYYDREQQTPGALICFDGPPCEQNLLFASSSIPWVANGGTKSIGTVLSSSNLAGSALVSLNATWTNGWGDLRLDTDLAHALTAPLGKSTIVDSSTGIATTGLTLIYHGMPAIGFATQSYSTTGLPGVNASVLSNYGGSFEHKVTRRIEIAP